MHYGDNYYAAVMGDFDRRRLAELERTESLLAKLRALSPEFAEIDGRLASVGARLLAAGRGPDREKNMAQIKNETVKLRQRRIALLESLGYAADAADPHFECAVCQDTGYTEDGMCVCLRKALAKASLEASGLGVLTKTNSFENFSLDYYKGSEEDYRKMSLVLKKAKEYAAGFSGAGSGNLLLIGNTGLGKTHICCAIAREIAQKGYRIVYAGAQRIFDDFSEERFRNGGAELSNRYRGAELLIIDDLGTEVSNQFTVACLYDIINSRLISGLPTIVNTNLTPDEMRERYTDRVASRLFGEFSILPFVGKDIRMLKIFG